MGEQGILTQENASSLASSVANALSASSSLVPSAISTGVPGLIVGPSIVSSLNAPIAGFAVPGVAQVIVPTAYSTLLAPVLSPAGLASTAATSRINDIAQSLSSTLSSGSQLAPDNVLPALIQLSSSIQSGNPDLDPAGVLIESLLEYTSALLALLQNAQITTFDAATLPAFNTALVNYLVPLV
uniref:Tubuliform spidroin 1 variant 1 n=1 Tax=Latrodectus hesperus TaxID=256737 RepID=A0A2S2B4R3_LATHE|nr:tubuliform spidroin 1 variant 1 [Latrodectus hesperus]